MRHPVAILYSSSQNSLSFSSSSSSSKGRGCRNPLFIKSEFSHHSLWHLMLDYYNCRNPLFIKSEFSHHEGKLVAEDYVSSASRNPLFIKSEFSPALIADHDRSVGLAVAILYSSSQNSLLTNTPPSPAIWLASQSFIHQVRILSYGCGRIGLALSVSGRNPLFIKSEFSLDTVWIIKYLDLYNKSQSFIHQVRILSAPPQPLALHGLKYSFPQTSVFQL